MEEKKKTIAFGVAGEGRGHAARTIALTEALHGIYKVVIFAPDTISDFLAENLPCTEIIKIPGITFYKENHVIRYRKTVLKNIVNIGGFNTVVKKLSGLMRDREIQTLISDFEPFTATAASRQNIPVLNLNHPGVVLRYFSLKPDAVAAKITARIMMHSGAKKLICSFYGGDIGPIIRKAVKTREVYKGDYFVVYTKADSREAILDILKKFPDTSFMIFPDKKEDFTKALAGCKGIITSSGHQILSEALYLKKPVLAFPQKMQFEQRLNAIMLERSGWGIQGNPSQIERSIKRFIKDVDEFPHKETGNNGFIFTDSTFETSEKIITFVESGSLGFEEIQHFPFRNSESIQLLLPDAEKDPREQLLYQASEKPYAWHSR